MQDKIVIKPATLADITPYYDGRLPPNRCRAYAGKLGEQTLGVGGIYFLSDGTRVGFLILEPDGYKYPRALYRAARWFLDMMKEEGIPSIRAVADPEIPKAARFLKNIGFTEVDEFQGQVVYQWLGMVQ